MAVDTNNPSGAICVFDGGTPRIITILAEKNISGGYWVTGSGVAGAATVTALANSFVSADIVGYPVTASVTSSGVMGVALTDIASGTYGPCAMRGVFLMPVGSATLFGSVPAGTPVSAFGVGGVVGSTTLANDCGKIGRALTDGGGAANDYVAVSVNI